jgi:hypothetical protein
MRVTSFGLISKLLFGSFENVIPEVVLLKNLCHPINLLLHACKLGLINTVAVTAFGLPFLSFSTFGA